MSRLSAVATALTVLLGIATLPTFSHADARAGAVREANKPPPPLDGTSYDYNKLDVNHPARAWFARAFVHRKAREALGTALPLLVFIHGLNTEKIKYRWMGGGQEGDVRRIISELIEAGKVPPMILAAPSTVDPVAATNAATSWPLFDLESFIDETSARLRGIATIDKSRIIVAGHSGAGCNVRGGIVTALRSKTKVAAGLLIDTCMSTDVAKEIAHLSPALNLVVSWQSMTWAKRPFDDFRRVFLSEMEKQPPSAGTLRELAYEQPKEPMPHDAMVGVMLKKWLPKLLSQPAPPHSRDSGQTR